MVAWAEVFSTNNTARKLVSDLLGRVYWCTSAGTLYCYDEVTDSSFQLADISGYIVNGSGGTGTPTFTCRIVDLEFHNGMVHALILDNYGWNGWNFAGGDGAYKAAFRVVTIEPYSGTTSLLCDSWLGTGMDGGKRVYVPDFVGSGPSYAEAASVWNCKFVVWQGRLWVTLEGLNYEMYVVFQGFGSHEPNCWCVYKQNDSMQFEESLRYEWADEPWNNSRFRDTPILVTDPNEVYVRSKSPAGGTGTRIWSKKIGEAWTLRNDFNWGTAEATAVDRIQCAGDGYIWSDDSANTSRMLRSNDYGTNWGLYNDFVKDTSRATGYFKGVTVSGWLFGCEDNIYLDTTVDFNSVGLRPYNFVYTNKWQYMIDTDGHVWKRGENVGGVFALGPPMNSMDIDITGDLLYIAGMDVLTGRPVAMYVTITGVPNGAFGLMAGDNGIAGVRAGGPYDCIGFGRFGEEAQIMLAEGITVSFEGATPSSEGLPTSSIVTSVDHDSTIAPEAGYCTLFGLKDFYTTSGIMGGAWVYDSDIPFNARCMHRMWMETGESGIFIGASGVTAGPVWKNVDLTGWGISADGLPDTIITEIDSNE